MSEKNLCCPNCGTKNSYASAAQFGFIRDPSGKIIKEVLTCINCGTKHEQPYNPKEWGH